MSAQYLRVGLVIAAFKPKVFEVCFWKAKILLEWSI